jgi:serine/threonine protein kinase
MCQTLRKRETDVQVEINKSKNNKGTKKNICNNCQQTINECICLKNLTHLEELKNDEYTTQAYDLLTKLLEVNPNNRISAQNAVEHPYFNVKY